MTAGQVLPISQLRRKKEVHDHAPYGPALEIRANAPRQSEQAFDDATTPIITV